MSNSHRKLLWIAFIIIGIMSFVIAGWYPFARQNSGVGSSGKADVLPLREFITSVRAASFEQYAGRPDARVADTEAFAEMRGYILQRYDGIDTDSIKSVVDFSGVVFDCLPQSATVYPPPTLPDASANLGTSDLQAQQNGVACPSGTIPDQRITLNTLVNFQHLQDFFRK